jgi:TolA-binding protein
MELRSELRALRERAEKLEARLALLEERSAARSMAEDATASSRDEMPALTVVKLKPKRQAPPPLATRTKVVEPSQETLEEIASAEPVLAVHELPAEDPAILEVKYEDAVAALRVGNVEGGVGKLEQFAEANRKHPKADNALYFAGIGRMGLQDYAGAAQLFESLLQKYPAGDAVLDGMLKLAECHVRLRRAADARTLYARIVASYPGTAAATQAEQQLSSLPR